jgi:soluble lytic murein transglycosylase-like protein
MKWLLPLLLLMLPGIALAETYPSMAEQCVQHYAMQYGVPPEMIAALIDVESQWNPRAVSDKGAMGLMQLMPAPAQRFGTYQPFDVEQNIAVGTRHTRHRFSLDYSPNAVVLTNPVHMAVKLVTQRSDIQN